MATNDFLLVVNRHFYYISYRLSVTCDFYRLYGYTENDTVPVSPLGASKVKFYRRFRKATTDFVMVVNCKFCSITHCFRVVSDFSDFGGYTGSDVTPFSPLSGATRQILWPILKGDQRLTISDLLKHLLYSVPFSSYTRFLR